MWKTVGDLVPAASRAGPSAVIVCVSPVKGSIALHVMPSLVHNRVRSAPVRRIVRALVHLDLPHDRLRQSLFPASGMTPVFRSRTALTQGAPSHLPVHAGTSRRSMRAMRVAGSFLARVPVAARGSSAPIMEDHRLSRSRAVDVRPSAIRPAALVWLCARRSVDILRIVNDFQFVPLSESDIPQVQEWHSDARVSKWYGGAEWPPKLWEIMQKDSNRKCWLVFLDDKAIGYIDFEEHPATNLAWMGITVKPELQGQGFGKRILHVFLEHPAAKKYPELWAGIEAEHAVSRRLFESAGFTTKQAEPDEEGIMDYSYRF